MPDSRGGGPRRWWPRPVEIPKEAQREADRRAGESLVSLLDQEGKAEVEKLLARGAYVYAVRRVRELTGLRLIDARRMVDSLRR
jgi:ribosomal protein L7/L12